MKNYQKLEQFKRGFEDDLNSMNSEEMEKMLDLELANMKYDPSDD